LLVEQPQENVAEYMLNHFKAVAAGVNSEPETIPTVFTRREQRIYLTTKVTPILSALMTRIAAAQPENVAEFAAGELQQIVNHGIPSINSNTNTDTKQKSPNVKRPHSARSKLNEAVAFDKSNMNASKIERPGTAPQIKPDPPAKTTAGGSIATDNTSTSVPKVIQIAVLGIAGSGKTAIINSLQGAWDNGVKPTLGFRPTTMMLGSDAKIKFYDLGGGSKIRDIWEQYYHDIHAVMYIVDSSAKTEEQWAETNKVFQNTYNNALVQGKPVLVLANKQDVTDSHSIDAVCELLQFGTNRVSNIVGCSAFHKPGKSTHHHLEQPAEAQESALEDLYEVDKRLEMGLEWLLTVVNSEYEELNARVLVDTKKKTADEAKKRLQRERKVLRNKIASVFLDSIPANLLPDGVEKSSTEEIYDEAEGIKFLADEIGQAPETLPEEAIHTAQLIGYQRLALQMIGALNCPISKKKTPMSWEEIKHMIVELREELGLSS
jgi:GTPase SAR1 family protein